MEVSFTASEIAKYMGVTRTAISIRAKREKWPFIRVKCRGGRTKKFKLDEIPQNIKTAIVKKIAGGLAPSGDVIKSAYINDKPELAAKKLDEAISKANLVNYYIGWVEREPDKPKKQRADQFVEFYSKGIIHKDILEKIGPKSYKTLERWKLKLKRGADYRVLNDQRGEAPRISRAIKTDQGDILRNMLLFPNGLNKAEVIRSSRAVMAQKGIAAEFCDHTARRWIDKWISTNYNVFVFMREGEKGLHNKCLPYISRDWSLIEVGDLLVADGHTMNFQILNPATGKPARMTLIVFFDMASNYPAGWEIMPHENTDAISIALRRAILRLGKIPRYVYMDNGRAFLAKYFTGCGDPGVMAGLYQRLGIRVINAWPYHPQSKPVERWFGSFAELERRALTYVGTSIDKKPPHLHRGEKLHRALHDKMVGDYMPTVEEVHRAIAAWVDDEYGSRPQKNTHLKGQKPLEVFEEGRGPGVDEIDINFMMLESKVMKINRNGVRIRLDGEAVDFYNPALFGLNHKALVRYDRFQLAVGQTNSVIVYDEKGRNFICHAERWDKIHPLAAYEGSESDRDEFKRRIKIKQSLKKQTTSPARKFVEEQVTPVALAQAEIAGWKLEDNPASSKKKAKPPSHKSETAEEIAINVKKLHEMNTPAREARAAEEVEVRAEMHRCIKLEKAIEAGEEIEDHDGEWMRHYKMCAYFTDNQEIYAEIKETYLKKKASDG